MFDKNDRVQISAHGIAESTVEGQIERFKKGFPWLNIVAPATPHRGIEVLDDDAVKEAAEYYKNAEIAGKCKFVPASGAASRMFKDIFAGLSQLDEGHDPGKESPVGKLAAEIEKFAFYDEGLFGKPVDTSDYRAKVAREVLSGPVLGYGAKPKGVIRFHRYPSGEKRTAFAEHLVEAQDYMRDKNGRASIVFTISPEYRDLFDKAKDEVLAVFESRYGVHYNIEFVYQDPSTDTIAVTPDNKPFRTDDGALLFRPAGHGSLIYNLNALSEELISIKNIDNVANERLLPLTSASKKALMGKCLQLRDQIFDYIRLLDMTDSTSEEAVRLCDMIESFLDGRLCVRLPLVESTHERMAMLRAKLDRPIRVCGMVRNSGEPGGGPFIVQGRDGSTNLQILESVQLDKSDPATAGLLAESTHFNPVDIVCCIHDHNGRKFDLLEYVDHNAGFISSKSYHGRELKALELPGLWNGAMSDWNTLFVEVPSETFNPVKVVLDLLRPAHQS